MKTQSGKVTGKTPVLWGSDFSFNVKGDSAQNYQHCGPMNLSTPYKPFSFNNRRDSSLRADMIAEAIQQYKQRTDHHVNVARMFPYGWR